MAIDKETVRRIAFLSRLRVDDDKIEATEKEFNKILQWVEQLKEVNTDEVEPLISVNENNLTLRADEVTEGNQADAVLANAPMKEYGKLREESVLTYFFVRFVTFYYPHSIRVIGVSLRRLKKRERKK